MSNTRLDDIKGIGKTTLSRLKNAKIVSVEQLANMDINDLIKIKGIGKTTAEKFINGAKDLLKNSKIKPSDRHKVKLTAENEIIKNLQNDIAQFSSRLDNFEIRLKRLETNMIKEKESPTKLAISKPRIEDQNVFSQILRERVQDLSKKRFGSKKIPIKELYDDLSKSYDINKETFSDILLNLYNKEKIQLEPGTMDNDFSIKDNFGNIYKIIRLLE